MGPGAGKIRRLADARLATIQVDDRDLLAIAGQTRNAFETKTRIGEERSNRPTDILSAWLCHYMGPGLWATP
ncbi:hypothetical protein PT2222_20333 [Paraburkholderia tropica]